MTQSHGKIIHVEASFNGQFCPPLHPAEGALRAVCTNAAGEVFDPDTPGVYVCRAGILVMNINSELLFPEQ